ncbi:IS66 family transposase [Clostridium sp.]|uniref:IS66 family transposase n=1 Tax=Clostridium sp. TaxID=1506 RepID=UPI0026377421|nr:IS66 family transposase [Clostridium sp.]
MESEDDVYEETQVNAHKRKKVKGKKEMDLSKFPVVRIEHKLSDEERYCEKCGKFLKEVTTEVTKRLRFVPAHFEVEEHVTSVYACSDSACGNMKRAPQDPALLKGSIATASIVAAVMNGKYVNGMPLNRQEAEFKRNGIELDRNRMSYWIIRCTENYLSLLFEELKKKFLECQYKQADETTVRVLHEDGRKATTNSYMWVYRTGELCNTPPVILYIYEQTRGGYHPRNFLGDSTGYLTTDGYQAYHSLEDKFTVTGCMSHCRRKFMDCLKVLPEKQHKGTIAFEAKKRISMLYQIEDILKERSPKERYEERLRQSKPILDAFFEWLEPMKSQSDSNSLIGKAIRYALNQRKYLEGYLLDGNIPIDNNASERAVKPFVMHRKAWLFCNTPNGADASGIIYSIVETAKANGLHPYNYLTHLLENIPKHMSDTNLNFLQELLPWSASLPDKCRVKNVELK